MDTETLDLNDIIRMLERQGPQERESPAGLMFNPFPVAGIAGSNEAGTLAPLEASFTEQVREFLIATLTSHSFTGMIVIGDFGLGKTHLLRWIEQVINSSEEKFRGQRMRAYYISNPGIRPVDILMGVTKAVGEEEFRKMLWHLIAEDLRRRSRASGVHGVRSAFGVETQQPLLGLDDRQIKALVQPDSLASLHKFQEKIRGSFMSPQVLRNYVTRVLTKVTSNLDVVQALASVLLDDEMKAFTSWVSLTSSEGRQQLKVPQEDYFKAILSVLKLNGIGTIFLLIDEFEDVVDWRLSKRQRSEYFATLRLLIDANVSDFSLVAAMTPEAWSTTKSVATALSDRLGGRTIDLVPLDQQRAEQLVRSYLSRARGRENGHPLDSLAPFTPEAVQELVRLSEGNTRAFVTACYQVLQQHWTNPRIDVDAVKATLAA